MSYGEDLHYSNPTKPWVETFDVIQNIYENIKVHEDNYCIKLRNII